MSTWRAENWDFVLFRRKANGAGVIAFFFMYEYMFYDARFSSGKRRAGKKKNECGKNVFENEEIQSRFVHKYIIGVSCGYWRVNVE